MNFFFASRKVKTYQTMKEFEETDWNRSDRLTKQK
jgi:hypothetical protein